jgi:mannose-6-phosphate isomerase-like protein (cupin superfamily)
VGEGKGFHTKTLRHEGTKKRKTHGAKEFVSRGVDAGPRIVESLKSMISEPPTKNYELAQLEALDPVRCPCGWSRRAFASPENTLATVHLVEILEDARTHYHKTLTETYVILEGEGWMELDGERIPVKPLSTIKINPGCRHRAIGKLKVLNFVIPAFDPEDEWFD